MKLLEMLEAVQETLDKSTRGERVSYKEISLASVRLESVISRIKQEKHYIRLPFFQDFPLLGDMYFPHPPTTEDQS